MSEPTTGASSGRVIQVSVSPGGVPKLPVERAWVGPIGLAGDAHHDDTVHGGPHRAVALFAIEAIRRVAAEGHPIFPGSAGENLTTEGIEWAQLPAGTRAAIGDRLVLEISKPDNPCSTIRGSFSDERFARISILTHPTDSRMYARVLVEGEVRPGDEIRILPPAPDSTADLHLVLDRIDAALRGWRLSVWKAAAATGADVRYVEDEELALGASPDLPGPEFNSVEGYRGLPNLLPRMLDWFRQNGTVGWIPAETPPWDGAVAEFKGATFAAAPDEVDDGAAPEGLVMREIGIEEIGRIAAVIAGVSSSPRRALAWSALLPVLRVTAGQHLWVAELDGEPVGAAGLTVRRKVGLLSLAAVLPAARRRGIQRALIAHRATAARELGCTLVAATADRETASFANLERMGLRPIWDWGVYRFVPGSVPAATMPP